MALSAGHRILGQRDHWSDSVWPLLGSYIYSVFCIASSTAASWSVTRTPRDSGDGGGGGDKNRIIIEFQCHYVCVFVGQVWLRKGVVFLSKQVK